MQVLFEIPVRIYHEDTDGGGIVYYANYLKYMERARTEYLRSLGFEQDELRREYSCIFVVTHVDIEYRRPAKFNDSLSASCELLQMRRASFRVRQDVRKNGPGESELLTASTVSLACLHCDTLAPHRIPGSLSKALANAPTQQ